MTAAERLAAAPPAPARPWPDACRAAALFAVDPAGIGGIVLRARAGPVRDRWLAVVRDRLPSGRPWRRVPLHVTDGRLLGGLDLAATLQAGRPVAERGLLAEADGGVVVLAMAERLTAMAAGRLTGALDRGAVDVERDGLALRLPASFGVIALDEGCDDDELPPPALRDRLAIHLDLTAVAVGALDDTSGLAPPAMVAAAAGRLASVTAADAAIAGLCEAAAGLGIASLRAPLLALAVARAAAALAGRTAVATADLALAARLVLAPRATRLPAEPPPAPPPAPPPPAEAEAPTDREPPEAEPADLDPALVDIVLAAAAAALPNGLLARLRLAGGAAGAAVAGRTSLLSRSLGRGRPIGVGPGDPRRGTRLNVVETLRAAAPWQPLRRREASTIPGRRPAGGRIEVRPGDFRITRCRQRSATTSIFVVDASGSQAAHRLAEAKGAVEMLLADCYIRRDRVALLAFRGRAADLLLPPTRSLVRAKRCLAGLPGGGGTPLAAGLAATCDLADSLRRRGETPVAVLLTDGSANIALDGAADRGRAEEEALAAAGRLRAGRVTALLVDTAPRPRPMARRIAEAMGALYLPLPYADAARLSAAVRAGTGAAAAVRR